MLLGRAPSGGSNVAEAIELRRDALVGQLASTSQTALGVVLTGVQVAAIYHDGGGETFLDWLAKTFLRPGYDASAALRTALADRIIDRLEPPTGWGGGADLWVVNRLENWLSGLELVP